MEKHKRYPTNKDRGLPEEPRLSQDQTLPRGRDFIPADLQMSPDASRVRATRTHPRGGDATLPETVRDAIEGAVALFEYVQRHPDPYRKKEISRS